MRINRIDKARKSPGTCQRCRKKIEVGQPYFWIKGMKSPKKTFCGQHIPRPSEMTGSDKLSTLYAAQEAIEDAIAADAGRDDLVGALRNAAETAREVGEEYRSSKENLPESFQNSSTGEALDEKADQCDQWADELEQAADDIEGMEDWDDNEKEAEEGENSNEDADVAEALNGSKAEAESLAQDAVGSLEL